MEMTPTSSPDRRRKRRGGPRRKTGCFTCKARHIRCDEKKPSCSNCEHLSLQCRASEFITHSAWSAVAEGQPVTSAQDQNEASVEASSSISNPSVTEASLRSLGSPISSHAESTSLAPNQTTTALSLSSSPAIPSALLKLNDEIVHLFNIYRSGLSTWMDIFDFENTYQRAVSRRAMYSELLLKCICAFTAKHLSLLASGEVWQPIAARYYGDALNCLINEVSCPEPHSDALTAAILLSSYEVVEASEASHRSHSQGALDLIRTRGISATSTGLDRANFFVYVRHEITIALANESSLQLDLECWNMTKPEAGAAEDRMAMYLMWLAGTAVNLVYDGESTIDRRELIEKVESWYDGITETFGGTEYGEVNDEGLKKVFFAVPAAAAAILWYHLIYILLFAEHRVTNNLLVQEHANRILSIGISAMPAGVRCFSILPTYYAGKHVDNITRKLRSLTLLQDIERELGYRTYARVRSLKQMIGQK